MSVKMIKPALYRVEGLPWAWVRLQDLGSMLCPESRSPDVEVLKRFFNLSKDAPQHGVLAVAWEGEENPQIHNEKLSFLRVIVLEKCLVPAGWAMDVISDWEQGVAYVKLEDFEHTEAWMPEPEGTLASQFNGSCFTAAVGLNTRGEPFWTYDDCEHSYGTVTESYLNPCSSAGCDLHSGQHRNCGQQYRERCARCGQILSDTADEEDFDV